MTMGPHSRHEPRPLRATGAPPEGGGGALRAACEAVRSQLPRCSNLCPAPRAAEGAHGVVKLKDCETLRLVCIVDAPGKRPTLEGCAGHEKIRLQDVGADVAGRADRGGGANRPWGTDPQHRIHRSDTQYQVELTNGANGSLWTREHGTRARNERCPTRVMTFD